MTRSKNLGKYHTRRLSMTMRVVRTYYWIQNFIKEHGVAPTYRDIGTWIGGSDNYYSSRNRGIQVCEPLLKQGFIARVGHGRGSKIIITDKPFTEGNIVIPTAPRPRHY